MERLDPNSRQSVALREHAEAVSFIAVQSVLRTDPDKARAVLQYNLDGEVFQALVFPIELEVVVLGKDLLRGDENGHCRQ